MQRRRVDNSGLDLSKLSNAKFYRMFTSYVDSEEVGSFVDAHPECIRQVKKKIMSVQPQFMLRAIRMQLEYLGKTSIPNWMAEVNSYLSICSFFEGACAQEINTLLRLIISSHDKTMPSMFTWLLRFSNHVITDDGHTTFTYAIHRGVPIQYIVDMICVARVDFWTEELRKPLVKVLKEMKNMEHYYAILNRLMESQVPTPVMVRKLAEIANPFDCEPEQQPAAMVHYATFIDTVIKHMKPKKRTKKMQVDIFHRLVLRLMLICPTEVEVVNRMVTKHADYLNGMILLHLMIDADLTDVPLYETICSVSELFDDTPVMYKKQHLPYHALTLKSNAHAIVKVLLQHDRCTVEGVRDTLESLIYVTSRNPHADMEFFQAVHDHPCAVQVWQRRMLSCPIMEFLKYHRHVPGEHRQAIFPALEYLLSKHDLKKADSRDHVKILLTSHATCNLNMLRLLLEHNANPNHLLDVVDKARSMEHMLEIIDLLLEFGLDLNKKGIMVRFVEQLCSTHDGFSRCATILDAIFTRYKDQIQWDQVAEYKYQNEYTHKIERRKFTILYALMDDERCYLNHPDVLNCLFNHREHLAAALPILCGDVKNEKNYMCYPLQRFLWRYSGPGRAQTLKHETLLRDWLKSPHMEFNVRTITSILNAELHETFNTEFIWNNPKIDWMQVDEDGYDIATYMVQSMHGPYSAPKSNEIPTLFRLIHDMRKRGWNPNAPNQAIPFMHEVARASRHLMNELDDNKTTLLEVMLEEFPDLDCNIQSKDGTTPLLAAIRSQAEYGVFELLSLQSPPVDVNACGGPKRDSPLIALMEPEVSIYSWAERALVQLLKRPDIDVNWNNADGYCALAVLISKRRGQSRNRLVKIFLEKCLKFGHAINMDAHVGGKSVCLKNMTKDKAIMSMFSQYMS